MIKNSCSTVENVLCHVLFYWKLLFVSSCNVINGNYGVTKFAVKWNSMKQNGCYATAFEIKFSIRFFFITMFKRIQMHQNCANFKRVKSRDGKNGEEKNMKGICKQSTIDVIYLSTSSVEVYFFFDGCDMKFNLKKKTGFHSVQKKS